MISDLSPFLPKCHFYIAPITRSPCPNMQCSGVVWFLLPSLPPHHCTRAHRSWYFVLQGVEAASSGLGAFPYSHTFDYMESTGQVPGISTSGKAVEVKRPGSCFLSSPSSPSCQSMVKTLSDISLEEVPIVFQPINLTRPCHHFNNFVLFPITSCKYPQDSITPEIYYMQLLLSFHTLGESFWQLSK